MTKIYKIGGMSCGGCAKSVEKAILGAAPGVAVKVDHAAGRAEVDGQSDDAKIKAAIEAAGFSFGGVE